MTDSRRELVILDDQFAVCRLDPESSVLAWSTSGGFFSITRTSDELSVVCRESFVPDGVRAVKGWRCLRLVGTFAFSMVGILASLTVPLAEAEVGVFAISTFDTDYLLVQEQDLSRAIEVLQAAGHLVQGQG